MADLSVQLDHGAQIKAGLKVAPQRMKVELRSGMVALSRVGRGWARAGAQAGTPMERHMAKGIGSSASSMSAAITVRNTASAPGARGAFYGSKKYPQFHKRWVGQNWAFPSASQGPQPIGAVFARHEKDTDALLLDRQMSAVARAFPGSTR